MNLDTITKGEELLSKATKGEWVFANDYGTDPEGNKLDLADMESVDGEMILQCASYSDIDLICFLRNHASELLQMAREVEERRKAMMFCSGPCNPSFTRAQIDVENNEAPVLSLDDYKRWT